ncbi:S24 family peptidase [Nocardioides bizhenqiangii]|uniref:S24 family peptidase n=1 Tax=Nocardioides bizhenqiangii TaxID=3095076 RepID=A0ABZ0ZLT2_9ACTN|nr:S24 family peptidase [Nocardioides sp. HM61]WQQ25220.1 S24 family peptidase [Nocardioides sp. HM61]
MESHPASRNDGRTAGRRSVVPLGLAVVRGASMRPTLAPGDRLLVRYRRTPRPGQVVVGRFADGTVAVKRAVEQRPGGWWLLSDNTADGVDSRHRGVVPGDDVIGVVLARLWPRPRRL